MQSSAIFVILSIFLCHQVNVISGNSTTQTCRYANEEYDVDPKRPQNTCEFYGCYGELQCPGSSETGGCYCKKGFARIWTNGPCIPVTHPLCACHLPPTPEDCQKRGEDYIEYLGTRACENTCANYNYYCGEILSIAITWKPRCDCIKGQARLPNGKCVSVDDKRCMKFYEPSPADYCKHIPTLRLTIPLVFCQCQCWYTLQ